MGFFGPKKPLSRIRRVLRVVVWGVFGAVVGLRWVTPHEPMPMIAFRNGAFQVQGAERPWGRRREPVPLYKPVKAIPKDLYRLEIEVGRKEEQILRGYFWNGWQGRESPEPRPEVKVTVREGGVEYRDVALHLKGSAGSFRPYDDKPAMTLNFGKHVKGRTFHGYTKFSLNNSVQDDTYLAEAISREIFEAAGVPAPRIEHATVVMNGRDLDLYVLSEGWGKPFLRRHFSDVRGNLYEGGFVRDITDELDVNSGDDEDDRGALNRLVAAASEPNAAARWEALQKALDVDRFLTFMAMEVMLCHWDGYCLNRNNYRIFHDRSTDRMVFLPHGLDQLFGTGRSSTSATIQPGMEGLVARAVTSTPEGRKRYLERIGSLRSTVFQEEKMTNRLWELSRRIAPTLEAYSPERAKWHQTLVADFAERIADRARNISEQLVSPLEGLKFDADGIAKLKGWRPSITGGTRGSVRFMRQSEEEGATLRIFSTAPGAVGSWRTRVWLDPGRYRFEADARTRGVGDSGGVCIRVSGTRTSLQSIDGNDWGSLVFGFELDESPSELELVCEFRSNQGEAWFREDSIRLVKEP